MKIFYFTATGNSLAIAKRFGAELYSIPKVLKGDQFKFEDEKIGLIFPCYNLSPPRIVREFIEKVTLDSPYIFVIMTYGNMVLDGINAFVKFAKKNNIHIQYGEALLMIDNYLPGFNIEKQKKIDKHIEENLQIIIDDISKNKSYIPDVNFVKSTLTVALQGIFNPDSNSAQDKKFLVGDNCNACGTCTKVCPRDNITINKNIDKPKPIYGGNCEFCLACINLCPRKSIRLKLERNSNARFMNENVTLKDIIDAND